MCYCPLVQDVSITPSYSDELHCTEDALLPAAERVEQLGYALGCGWTTARQAWMRQASLGLCSCCPLLRYAGCASAQQHHYLCCCCRASALRRGWTRYAAARRLHTRCCMALTATRGSGHRPQRRRLVTQPVHRASVGVGAGQHGAQHAALGIARRSSGLLFEAVAILAVPRREYRQWTVAEADISSSTIASRTAATGAVHIDPALDVEGRTKRSCGRCRRSTGFWAQSVPPSMPIRRTSATLSVGAWSVCGPATTCPRCTSAHSLQRYGSILSQPSSPCCARFRRVVMSLSRWRTATTQVTRCRCRTRWRRLPIASSSCRRRIYHVSTCPRPSGYRDLCSSAWEGYAAAGWTVMRQHKRCVVSLNKPWGTEMMRRMMYGIGVDRPVHTPSRSASCTRCACFSTPPLTPA